MNDMIKTKVGLSITKNNAYVDKIASDIEEITISKGKQATIFQTYESVQKQLHIIIEEGAQLTYFSYNNGNCACNITVTAEVFGGGVLKIYNASATAKDMNLFQKISLKGEHATCDIMNVLLLNQSAILNSKIALFHEVAYTNSSLQSYAIAKDNAILTLDNNATITKGAKGSVIAQKAKGLTLSQGAVIKAMPNLYIDEYDVIANHAAAIGSVNQEDLFYLMSRGLSEQEAAKIIVMGFVQPLLDEIKNDSFKQEMMHDFAIKLSL